MLLLVSRFGGLFRAQRACGLSSGRWLHELMGPNGGMDPNTDLGGEAQNPKPKTPNVKPWMSESELDKGRASQEDPLVAKREVGGYQGGLQVRCSGSLFVACGDRPYNLRFMTVCWYGCCISANNEAQHAIKPISWHLRA